MQHLVEKPHSRWRIALIVSGALVLVVVALGVIGAIRKADINCGPPRAYEASAGWTGEPAFTAAQFDYGDAVADKCFANPAHLPG